MKPTKEPDSSIIIFSKQLKKLFSDEQIASFVATLLGMSNIAHKFIWEKAQEFIELPIDVKYSTIKHAAFYRLLGLVIRDELSESEVMYMPTDELAWQSDEDFEKRFIFVVKYYYEGLKKQGKI